MAGCIPCFIIPLLLFIFHKFIQPIVLKFWNPWENKQLKAEPTKENKTEVEQPLIQAQEVTEKKEL